MLNWCVHTYADHVTPGRSGIGDACSFAAGGRGSADGCAAVPGCGVDVQRQNARRAHHQAEGYIHYNHGSVKSVG